VSSENVEIVRAGNDLWNGRKLHPEERSWEQVAQQPAAIALIGADMLFASKVLPDHAGEEYRGVDGVARAGELWIEDCEWVLVEQLEIIDADEHVVASHKVHMKMRHTSPRVRFSGRLGLHLPRRQVGPRRGILDIGEAREAAGLE